MSTQPALPRDTFRFFRELALNNRKPWMDANRERYRGSVVEPLRALFERLAPAATKLNPRFETTGRTGVNLSRINRDIRFAADKSPYRPQMYIFFEEPGGDGSQLYLGVSAEAVTCGFRIYASGRESPLPVLGRPRGREHAQWIERQRQRLGRSCESYWYSVVKGDWTKRNGWPVKPENWKKLQGWIVRRKFAPAAAVRGGFERQAAKIFRDVYPLYRFTTSPTWKP